MIAHSIARSVAYYYRVDRARRFIRALSAWPSRRSGSSGQIEVEALRLYGLPEAAPAPLCGTPALPVGQREFVAEVAWDLPSLAPGATGLLDVTVNGARQGDLAHAALASSTRFIELDAAMWSNNTVRVMARNISPTATFDLGAATLSLAARKRRLP